MDIRIKIKMLKKRHRATYARLATELGCTEDGLYDVISGRRKMTKQGVTQEVVLEILQSKPLGYFLKGNPHKSPVSSNEQLPDPKKARQVLIWREEMGVSLFDSDKFHILNEPVFWKYIDKVDFKNI